MSHNAFSGIQRCRHQVLALADLPAAVHARRKYGDRDCRPDIVQRLGEDADCVPRGRGGCVLEGDGEDDAFARKDRLAVRAIPSIKEPLDPKDTIRSF